MKIRPVEAELFHEYRRMEQLTDMTKQIVHICNFANAPKSGNAIKMHGRGQCES